MSLIKCFSQSSEKRQTAKEAEKTKKIEEEKRKDKGRIGPNYEKGNNSILFI